MAENLENTGGAWFAFGRGVSAEVCGERIFKTEFFENFLCGSDRLVCEHRGASSLGTVPIVFRAVFIISCAVPSAIEGDSLHKFYNTFVRFRIFGAMLPVKIRINFMNRFDALFAVAFASERFGDFFHIAGTCDGNEICGDCSADEVHRTIPDECSHIVVAMRAESKLRHGVIHGGGQIAKRVKQRSIQIENE